MFVFEFSQVRVRFCFSFFAVLSLTCLLGGESGKVLIMLACCALHESGHIAAMLMCGCKPKELTFYGAGIKLTLPKRINSFAKDAFILASGCAVNFLLAFSSFAVTGELSFFARTNLLLGGFNLLPVGFLDGGKLVSLALGGRSPRIVKAVFALLVVVLAAASVLRGSFSPSLICVLVYMCLSVFAS